jgi:Glycosyl hydrolases family 15
VVTFLLVASENQNLISMKLRTLVPGIALSEVGSLTKHCESQVEHKNHLTDGPALRSTTLITYANWLLNKNNTKGPHALWPFIKLDLDYVATWWGQTTCVRFPNEHPLRAHVFISSYDLWEEVRSSSFFTTAVQHRALREGATLAAKLGDSISADTYNTQATNVLCFLQVRRDSSISHEAHP